MNFNFRQLFLLELGDMFNAEQQIIEELPNIIRAVQSEELRTALRDHLEETREQLQRLKRIYRVLNETPHNESCRAMDAILEEGREFIERIPKSTLRDAALIGACQKVEHYEISAYGTLYAHAEDLSLDSEVLNLIDDNLDEESSADSKLSSLAQGGIFTTGINMEAVSASNSREENRYR